MNFKYYDILSNLVPGYVVLILIGYNLEYSWNNDFVIPATAVAYIVGYFINSISSWLEVLYFYSWGGKPSNQLLKGRGTIRIKFYYFEEALKKLKIYSSLENPSNDALFEIARRKVSGNENFRVDEFNAAYAFSRTILTTSIISVILLFSNFYLDWQFWVLSIFLILFAWYRAKERAYYYSKEVLNEFINAETTDIKN